MQHRITRIAAATGLAFVLVCASSAALADGGSITSVTATPASVFQGDSFTISVKVKGSVSVNCNMAWQVNDAYGNTVATKSGAKNLTGSANEVEFTKSIKLPKPGTFTIVAGPDVSDSNVLPCTASKQTTIVVKDKSLLSSTPAAKVSPSPTQRVSPSAKTPGLVVKP